MKDTTVFKSTYRTLYPTIRKCAFFISTHEAFIKSDPIPNPRTSPTNDYEFILF